MGENRDIAQNLFHVSRNYFHGDPVSDFKMLEYLSPVRNQGFTEGCLYVATAGCLEMTLRLLGIRVPSWDEEYFLDIPDAIDQIFRIYGVSGVPVRMDEMISFISNHGYKVTSSCKQPREVDEISSFDDKALRCKIHAAITLKDDQVMNYLERFPIIVGLYAYTSLTFCAQAVYEGPNEIEKMVDKSTLPRHAALVVGSMRAHRRSGDQTYLIIQNSYGKYHGYFGYVLIPFPSPDICTTFEGLHINPEKFPYKKIEDETFEFIETRRGV